MFVPGGVALLNHRLQADIPPGWRRLHGCIDRLRINPAFWICLSYAGGIQACSRWLSSAIPPDPALTNRSTPDGVPRTLLGWMWPPSRVWRILYVRSRWCRFAQPPATGWHPCGMGEFRFSQDIRFPFRPSHRTCVCKLKPAFSRRIF